MLSIKTNLSNLNAQSNLKLSNTKLNQAVERLSSGYKLNHASDNAANYSISTNMSTKLGAYQVAEENAMQGLEMMTTTSDMLSQIEDKLLRMRVLAVQTLNGTNGTKSMTAIDSEAQSLYDEIVRINESATYNGIKLFNTGKQEVTNAGKELELNEQGFLQDVVQRDVSAMTTLQSVDTNVAITSGTYSITTIEELEKLADMTNNGLIKGGEFVLGANIDLKDAGYGQETGQSWQPIGRYYFSGGWKGGNFNATFDGNGYTISNLYMSFSSGDVNARVGLFGISNGTIKNLRLTNVDVRGGSYGGNYVGAIVGFNIGTVDNCSVTGIVRGGNDVCVGGITGGSNDPSYNRSKVTNCYFDGDVIGAGQWKVGGIAGIENKITNCLFIGNVQGGGAVGGIAASAVLVDSSNSNGYISGINGVGGILGDAGTAKNSYFSGSVDGQDKVGGISGTGTVNNCIVEGSVNGVTNVGIFSGGTSVTVKDCYYYGKNLMDMSITADDSLSTISNIIDITIPCDYVLQVGTESDSGTSLMEYTTYIEFSGLKTLLSQGISDKSATEKIDGLLNVVSLKQTEIGAVENRLYSVLEELDVKYDNLLASRSTICDTNVAEVSSTYIKQQILQNAGATLMSTSQNVNANMVLGLLQGLNG